MSNEITPEQKAQLTTWAGQRDIILLEISALQTEKEKLESKNKELAESSVDIDKRMNITLGRIQELENKERELPELISKSIASLNTEKSNLETQIPLLNSLVNILEAQKESLKKDVASELNVFSEIKETALSLEKVVSHVTVVSDENKKKINSLVLDLEKSLEEIIKVNKKNVEETNIVIDKVPRMLVEIQKKGLARHKL